MSSRQSRSKPDYEYQFKTLVIGGPGTGKTSFIKRYVHQFFSPAYRTTLGVDFALKTLIYEGSMVVRLQLWDVAGQERFGCMTRGYFKDADGAFIMFDVSDTKSFNAVLRWKADLNSKVKLSDGQDIPCVLVGNKSDLKPPSIKDEENLREFAKQNGFIDCIFTSPKDNVNIEQTAELLVRHLVKQEASNRLGQARNNIRLNNGQKDKRFCFCK